MFRRETIGALLVVAAAATIPYLLPLAGVIGDLRDSLVRLFGLNIFGFVVVLAGSGLVLALHKQNWARAHARHLLGGAAVLVFIAGVLGRWHPSTVVGSVDLAEVSAGGDSGAALAAGLAGTLVWLAMIPLAYALLWPRTALAGLRASPGTTWAALRWAWGLGIHRAVGRGLRALAQLLLGMNRRGTADDEAFEPIVARTAAPRRPAGRDDSARRAVRRSRRRRSKARCSDRGDCGTSFAEPRCRRLRRPRPDREG